MGNNKLFYLILTLFFISYGSFSVDFELKIAEKSGKINIREKDGEWTELTDDMNIPADTEIFTDFHSSITFEIGPGSYVTVNQLTNLTVKEQKINLNDVMTEMDLSNGFIIVYAAVVKSYKNRIKINLPNGYMMFEKSGGEVYSRAKQGAIIKSFQGSIRIYPKIKTFYFITKNEMCGITSGGILLENDYFLRRNMNTIPGNIENPGQMEYYFNYIFQPYTEDIGSNDYRDALVP